MILNKKLFFGIFISNFIFLSSTFADIQTSSCYDSNDFTITNTQEILGQYFGWDSVNLNNNPTLTGGDNDQVRVRR